MDLKQYSIVLVNLDPTIGGFAEFLEQILDLTGVGADIRRNTRLALGEIEAHLHRQAKNHPMRAMKKTRAPLQFEM